MTFLAGRIGTGLIILFLLTTLVFFIGYAAPGDPVMLSGGVTMSASTIFQLRHEMGLDQPLLTRYARWIGQVVTGDFGYSVRQQRPVKEAILDVLPCTFSLAGGAIVLELIIGLAIGTAAARFRSGTIDRVLSTVSLVIYTVPAFWLGIMLLSVFSYGLGLFPSSQLQSINGGGNSTLESLADRIWHLGLPWLTLAVPGAGAIARYFRDSLITVRGEEYVLFARSRGVSPKTIFLSYELPNAVGAVIAVLGTEIGALLAGVVVTETVFALPGMGRLAMTAILTRDYPLIMGCTIFAGAVVIVGNLLADVAHGFIDPRVRLA